MLIRKATHDDIQGVAVVAAAAYMTDPQDTYLYQHRSIYSSKYIKAKSSIIRDSLDDLTAIPTVAVLGPDDKGWNGLPTIVGFCIWFLEEPTAESTHSEKRSLREWIKTSILDTELTDRLRDFVNPIINSSHAKAMAEHCRDENSRSFIEGYSTPERYYGVLDIGVDPKFQRRGVARLLLEDGLNLAESQGLPVRLSATPAGVPLYQSLGFRNVGQWTWRPKQEVPWEIMQWDPIDLGS